jgi:hypothetical protein
MKVLLNGVELQGGNGTAATVGEVLDQLRTEIGDAGKLITAIAIDGQLLESESQREKARARLQSKVERIELTVEEPKALLHKGLSDTRDFLQSLRRDFVAAATAFRLGDEVTANDDLVRCLDDLKLVLTGMSAASRLPGAEMETDSLKQTLVSANARLLPVLDSMYKAQAAGDYVSLADGLEYDLTEIADEWLSVLNHTIQKLTVAECEAVGES